MKKLFLIILSLLLSLPSFCAMTSVKGTISGVSSGKVRLLTYQDMISYKKRTLATCEIGSDGQFSFSVDLSETTYALIDYNFQQLELFLQAGMDYQLTLKPEDNASSQVYYDRPSLDILILEEEDPGINTPISEVNVLYNDFLLDHAQLLQSPSRKEKVGVLVGQLEALAEEGADPYLSNYIRYKIASLEMFFRLKGNDKLAAEYLTDQPVLYGNVEYMDFFHLYFEKYLLTNNSYLPFSKTSSLINGNSSLSGILAEFMKDPVLRDTRLAELVLLAGIKDMAVTPGFKMERITFILDEVIKSSPYPENRLIAKNLKERLEWMKPGTDAPAFELADVSGKLRHLSDYRGKYLYLGFINLYNPPSLAEVNQLADIYQDFKDRINFASILLDELKPGWNQIVHDYRMNWDLLLAGGNVDLIEKYGAMAPPLFVLISPQGKIVRYPAPNPSEGLREVLESY